ncbi:cytochrome-c peroxidase [Oceanimonas baumannii]|uniref:Cytochrome-c peroxidase n=1 Tax=Oceanimonas baumannii TaxID=129578 RepID=A0A235CKL4_9GAMM|nr:cytochrome c peroxidase [Oceanimonas baumannii]OYD25080.1 cytochrome-c peroxidase [Oceanimonas baumannii]TDW59861.1 cytochrome c peroxidase [Oceanimonas baumannii]
MPSITCFLAVLLSASILLASGVVHADISPEQYRQPPALWPAMNHSNPSAKELAPLPGLPRVSWHTPRTERLGYQLFFDPRLSGSGQIACASCHDPDLGWADGRQVAIGHNRQAGIRNTMSILNSAYFKHLFWDGRAKGLIDQALDPISNPLEMNASLPEVLDRLNAIPGYQQAFAKAFNSERINADHLAMALAAFERSIVSRPNRLDRFINGNYQALTDQQIKGLHLFRTKAGCISCHSGALYSDGDFHHTGLSYYGRKYQDTGLEQVTGRAEDRGKFRTPSLRDLAYTGPWMHNGLFPSIRGILNMYNAGMIGNTRLPPGLPPLSVHIKPLHLSSAELDALEAFLSALNQQPYRRPLPKLPDYLSISSWK